MLYSSKLFYAVSTGVQNVFLIQTPHARTDARTKRIPSVDTFSLRHKRLLQVIVGAQSKLSV